jgi:hypothetical protein
MICSRAIAPHHLKRGILEEKDGMADSDSRSIRAKTADSKATQPLVEDLDREADYQFLDDLGAVGRFKTFLVGRGRPVSDEVSAGIGKLLTAFVRDLERYEDQIRDQENWKNRSFWFRTRI